MCFCSSLFSSFSCAQITLFETEIRFRVHAGVCNLADRRGFAGEERESATMALKSIQRSATVAFAPMAQIMGVGTMAGAIDLSFSSSASLELLKLDFASTELDLPVLGSCVATERFNRLSWSNIGAGSLEEYPLGLIAGGLADGSIHLWNPAKLARWVAVTLAIGFGQCTV